MRDGRHRPKGLGDIYQYGVPECGDGEDVPLGVAVSTRAQAFLNRIAALNSRTGLDHRGWSALANGPMQGWPSKEIIEAMNDTPGLRALVPIDILGMVTDRNPEGLYW